MQGDARLVWQSRLGPVLRPAGWMYGAVQRTRRWAYHKGLMSTVRVDRPVVSVGSLLSGGTGKTPLVAYLSARYSDRRVALLSRGYGGTYQGQMRVGAEADAGVAGDEPVLLARTCPAHVWVAKDRAELARRLQSDYDLILLDDGYQHLKLERFLNICVLPPDPPGHMLPAGLWREGPSALRDADLVIALDRWPDYVSTYYDGPRLVITLRRGPWQGEGGTIQGGSYLAFCGVARPERFVNSFSDLAVVDQATFPDHHPYTRAEIEQLQERAQRAGASGLLTTAKDAVRIRREWLSLPLFWCDLEIGFLQGENEFRLALESLPAPD